MDSLKQRLELLEKSVALAERRHAEKNASLESCHAADIARRDELHQERLDNLLQIISSLQASRDDCRDSESDAIKTNPSAGEENAGPGVCSDDQPSAEGANELPTAADSGNPS